MHANVRIAASLFAVLCACSSDSPANVVPGPVPTTSAPTKPDPTMTSPIPSTTPPGPDGGPTVGCPRIIDTSAPVTVDSADVVEASGIVDSSLNKGVYWMHNDSGDTARAFAVNHAGKTLVEMKFDYNVPTDIEDIAIEDLVQGKSNLYFGDIGDNNAARTSLVIHRVAEPTIADSVNVQKLTVQSEKMTVTYSDGAHNAETLLFDPDTKDLLIATKKAGGPSVIHRVGKFVAGGSAVTEPIASAAIDLATGGEISRDGRMIAIRNYTTSAFFWPRKPGESIADAMKREPCKIPIDPGETKGEAFAFLAEGKGYATISEGASPAVHVTLFE